MFGDGGSSGGGSTTTIYDGNVTIVDQPVTANIDTDVDPGLWTVTFAGHELEYYAQYDAFDWYDDDTGEEISLWCKDDVWVAIVSNNGTPIPGTYALNIVAPEDYLTITRNGGVNVSGYSTALVQVPASGVVSGTKQITTNGSNIDVTDYAAVDVNVAPSLLPVKIVNNSPYSFGVFYLDSTGNAANMDIIHGLEFTVYVPRISGNAQQFVINCLDFRNDRFTRCSVSGPGMWITFNDGYRAAIYPRGLNTANQTITITYT